MDIPLYINIRTINIESLVNPKWFKKQLNPYCGFQQTGLPSQS